MQQGRTRVTLAAGSSTPQVYNVNWVVPPAGDIPQKWGGHVPPSSYGGAAPANPQLKHITHANGSAGQFGQ